MAVFLRRSLNGSRGTLALSMPARNPRSVLPLGRLMAARPSLRPTHSSIPVRTVAAAAPTATTTAAAADPAADAETTARGLEQELFKVLCEPRPSNPLLVALVRALVQLGEQPSVEVVRAVARHFLDTKDIQSSKAVLSLLKSATPRPLTTADASDGGNDSGAAEDAIDVLFSCVVRARCRRQDVSGALAEVAEMDGAPGRPPVDAKVFLSLLKACAAPRPPLSREAEAVWAQAEERGLLTEEGVVRQDLFTARMAVDAKSAGYPSLGVDSQEALLQKVDGAWDEMLEALAGASESAGAGSGVGEGVEVTRDSWIARAAALALCARDAGAGSDSTMTRSLEALESYMRSGGGFFRSGDVFALAEVVRGLARCSRQSELAALLVEVRRSAAAAAVATGGSNASTTVTAPADANPAVAAEASPGDVAEASETRVESAAGVGVRAARIPEELLRALGARGAGLDSGGAAYGLSLLKAVEEIAAEAQLRGRRSRGDVDSRLTATLQAILTASHFLDREDAALVNAAARGALEAAAVGVAAAEGGGGGGGEGEVEVERKRELPGPGLSSLALFALLHVSKKPREGIPVAIDVLQEIHDRGQSPPPSLAAQLDVVVKRHGTARQKRRATFLLARALDGFGSSSAEDEVVEAEAAAAAGGAKCREKGERGFPEKAGGNAAGGGGEGGGGVGAAILDMVKSAPNRGQDEWDPEKVAAGESSNGLGGGGGGRGGEGGGDGSPLSAAQSYRQLRRRMRGGGGCGAPTGPSSSSSSSVSAGVRRVERACSVQGDEVETTPLAPPPSPPGAAAAAGSFSSHSAVPAGSSHREVLERVAVLAERGNAHAALAALQGVDGRKKGARVSVPFRVYGLVFRALSSGYSARGKEELELAAAPTEALQWLLRGVVRQGYKPTCAMMNFGLEAFAVAARTRKVREGGEGARARVCTEAIDFMAGMREGGNGLHPPVSPNLVSFNIMIKVMCRLDMFDQAFEMLDVLERAGFEPDRVTYSTLIHGLSRSGDCDGAWEVMLMMTNKGIAPHSIAIDGIVDGFVRIGDVGQAISFAQHAFNQYGCPPTAEKFCRVVHAAVALDDGHNEARRAVTVAEQMWQGDWRGGGMHPVLGHPNLKSLLEERGVLGSVDVNVSNAD